MLLSAAPVTLCPRRSPEPSQRDIRRWCIVPDIADPTSHEEVCTLFRTWQNIIHRLAASDVELEIEEIAPALSTFSRLRSAGVEFDPMLCVLMQKLMAQAFGLESDEDHSDEHPEPNLTLHHPLDACRRRRGEPAASVALKTDLVAARDNQ